MIFFMHSFMVEMSLLMLRGNLFNCVWWTNDSFINPWTSIAHLNFSSLFKAHPSSLRSPWTRRIRLQCFWEKKWTSSRTTLPVLTVCHALHYMIVQLLWSYSLQTIWQAPSEWDEAEGSVACYAQRGRWKQKTLKAPIKYSSELLRPPKPACCELNKVKQRKAYFRRPRSTFMRQVGRPFNRPAARTAKLQIVLH